MKKVFIIFSSILVILILSFFYIKNLNQKSAKYPQMIIGNHKVYIELADTLEKQTQGLSGISKLEEETGMLFPYNPPQMVSFWMKDMLIPIDIIFIKDNKVVTLYDKVQPEPNTSLSQLKRYSPNQLIDYVLEVPAGWSQKNGIAIGTKAIYKPTPDLVKN